MEYNTIYQGDCHTLFRRVPTGTVDLAIIDPPYNIGFDYGEGEYDDALPPAEYSKLARRWLTSTYTALSDSGTFWLIIGDEWQADLQILARSIGFHLRSHVIWHYSFGVNSPSKFARSHAHLLYFVKSKTKFTFNSDKIRVPSARAVEYKDKRANPAGKLPDDTWVIRPQASPEQFSANDDTWFVSRVCGTFKERIKGAANQLPEQLVGRIIRACSNPGDLVLDPMCGTGTVPAVARKLDRRYIGFEQSEKFAKISRERTSIVEPSDPLDGPIPQGG